MGMKTLTFNYISETHHPKIFRKQDNVTCWGICEFKSNSEHIHNAHIFFVDSLQKWDI